jgi:hypothetical protein
MGIPLNVIEAKKVASNLRGKIYFAPGASAHEIRKDSGTILLDTSHHYRTVSLVNVRKQSRVAKYPFASHCIQTNMIRAKDIAMTSTRFYFLNIDRG